MDKADAVKPPSVMTIGGFDPSCGAGVVADTSTFLAFNCVPRAAITSTTFQTDEQVFGCLHQEANTLRSQVAPILRHERIDSVKTGMLPTREIVLEVASLIIQHDLQTLVVDPVMQATSGYELVDIEAIKELRWNLLPLARLVTPNIFEAEALVGFSITNEAKMRRAAELIRAMGPQAVLVKGGHLPDAPEAIDLLDDGEQIILFRGPWIDGGSFHGSGCVLSAAITACLAKGLTLPESVQQAKDFVAAKMRGRTQQ
jgi:hydroxymethylpyrimidine/phosphomethylpyrimidine kinase